MGYCDRVMARPVDTYMKQYSVVHMEKYQRKLLYFVIQSLTYIGQVEG